jgi:2-polyprenyl-3-methyl-5-hydroxy-6-metoxy-1,4-benzoquinol methylase
MGGEMGSVYELKESLYGSHTGLLDLCGDGHGKRLLDIGCGNGYLSDLLHRRGFEVVGMEHPLGHDGPFPAGVRLIERDLDLPFEPLGETFDVIVLGDVLEHLRRPAELLTALAPMLRPSGRIVASLPNSGNLYFRLNVLLGRFPEDEKGLFDKTHLHFWMLRNWENLFSRAGYQMHVEKVTGIPVSLAAPRLGWMEGLCYHLARGWKTLFAYQFLVTARPKSLS